MGKAAPTAAARDEWLRRVEAEYRSTAVSANLALWLVQIGASPDLVKTALRVAREELGHATGSHRVYVAAGGGGGPRLDRGSLELPRTPGAQLEDDVARVCLEVFCLGETVAVRLFGEMRRRCDVPVARRLLDRILLDEVRHREFGWTLLGWLLALPDHGPRIRSIVISELPSAFARLHHQYVPEEVRVQAVIPREDSRWGLLPGARYGEVLGATLDRDYGPRLARLGVDARAAWPRVAAARLARAPVSE